MRGAGCTWNDILDKDDNPVNTSSIIPIYPLTNELRAAGIEQRLIRKAIELKHLKERKQREKQSKDENNMPNISITFSDLTKNSRISIYTLTGKPFDVCAVSSSISWVRHLKFIKNLENLLDRIKIPNSLGEINVPEDCAGRIAEKAMKDQAYATNPKVASLAEMKEMVLQSIKKAR